MEKPVKACRKRSHESFFDAAGNGREIGNIASGSVERHSVRPRSFIDVDFSQLRLATLQKYTRYFEIKGLSTLPKHELVPFLKKHFERIPIENEINVFKDFIRRVRGGTPGSGPTTPSPTWEGQKIRNLRIDIIKKNNKQKQAKNRAKKIMMMQTRAGQMSQAKTGDSQLEKEQHNYGSFQSPEL